MRSLIIILLITIFTACSSSFIEKNSVRFSGPESMKELILKLNEGFREDYPAVNTYITFRNNSDAIEGLIDNEVDIVFSTRVFSVEETKLIAKKFQSIGVTTIFARDIIKVLVNNNNPLKNISTQDLLSILACSNNRWDFLTDNEADINISLLSELTENESPVKRLFLRNQSLCKTINILNDANKIIEIVLKDENAVGITGFINDVRVKSIAVNGVFPGESEIRNRRYPLEFYLNFLTPTEPQGNSKIFIDWVLSGKGQKIIDELGYGALFNTTH